MIRVLHPGYYSTIQDMGRVGYAHLGVPQSGVMDRRAAKKINAILGNPMTSALIEVGLGNAKFRFESPAVIAVGGARFNVSLNGTSIKNDEAIIARPGDIVYFKNPLQGVWAYLGVRGGIGTKRVLGSRSYYTQITPHQKLYQGQVLPMGKLEDGLVDVPSSVICKEMDDHFISKEIQVNPGPEWSLLSLRERAVLMQSSFTISEMVSRMGYRLKQRLVHHLPSILSSGVLPGTVQTTSSGQLIVLLRDAQATGGYPRILQLTSDAIDKFVQKQPGEQIVFKMF